MQYRVIEYFTDLQDSNHEYKVGDVFPREGNAVSDARIAELSSDKNRRGRPIIEKIEEAVTEEKPKRSAKAKAKTKRKTN